MRLERFYTLVGLFVGGACILLIFTGFFIYNVYVQKRSDTYIMFFKGSLKGLDTTSTVSYRGVKIGEIKLIELTENPIEEKIKIPVYVQFYVEKSLRNEQHPIQILIKKGYVAKIEKPNFLTGIASIAIVKSPTPALPEEVTYHGYRVFPTSGRESEFETLDETLKVAQKTLTDISKFVHSAQVQGAVNSIIDMSHTIENLAVKLDKQIPEVLVTFEKSLVQTSNAMSALQSLAEYISRNPEALIRGKQ